MSENPLFPPDSRCVDAVRPSPNHGPRAEGKPLDMVILHYTGMESGAFALERLTAADSGVSCHYFVDEDGTITQLVPEARRAWHAGASSWQSEDDINSRSIGIEIVNPGHQFGYREFPQCQIETVIRLCRDCGDRLAIPPQNVLAHSDVAPLRKEDPGELFPWRQLHEAGIGHWVKPDGAGLPIDNSIKSIEKFQSMLVEYGYSLEITGKIDACTVACITAFQRHFRPKTVDGIADQSTFTTLLKLLEAMS